jgi:hypothetical protein
VVKPPTREIRSATPEPFDLARLRGPSRAAYARRMLLYAHRRWCVVSSDGVTVLAVRGDLVFVVDLDADPDPRLLLAIAYQRTDRGVHLYLPPLWALDYSLRVRHPWEWGQINRLRDRVYCKNTMLRGYCHERIRTSPVVIPSTIVSPGPEWIKTLKYHAAWHRYAYHEYGASRRTNHKGG